MNFYEKTGSHKICGGIWLKTEKCTLNADKMAADSSVK